MFTDNHRLVLHKVLAGSLDRVKLQALGYRGTFIDGKVGQKRSNITVGSAGS